MQVALRGPGTEEAVEVELRMAEETSYTYFAFAKALDVFTGTAVGGEVPGGGGEGEADEETLEDSGGGAGKDDFAAFEAAMAGMDDGDDDDEDEDDPYGGDGEDDEELEGMYGDGGADGLGDEGDEEEGDNEEGAGGAGEAGSVRAATLAALRLLIAELELLQAGYRWTYADLARAAPRPAVGASDAMAVALVELSTLEFYRGAARMAADALGDRQPAAVMRTWPSVTQQDEDERSGDGALGVRKLCEGVGRTRLALAVLRIRCGLAAADPASTE